MHACGDSLLSSDISMRWHKREKKVFSRFLKTCEDESRKLDNHKQFKQTVSDVSVLFFVTGCGLTVDLWNVNNILISKCLKLRQLENVIMLILH